ncbi:HCL131Cp [Eremothecium sinecaudum]|uniref:HCL131Cp n=1 Tax=Eremothecium sinecaudum TaxID=45286 RepID=A0A0X8HRC7_9SACH|nr:HCL131Cp [Eremothecium sinecaudum]AMD20020.1 HCL131Cp [Eremothecium sinecaudum]
MSQTSEAKVEELFSDFEDDVKPKSSEVFLGFVDAAIKASDDITIQDTFIGGEPVWLHEDSIPDEKLLQCGTCKSTKNMMLLLQAFAPVDPEQVEKVCERKNLQLTTDKYIDSSLDRVLYVFICRNCGKKGSSVKCIRGVRLPTSNSARDELNKILETPTERKDFNINPFDIQNSDNQTNVFSANPFAPASSTSDENPFSSGITNNVVEAKTEVMKPSTARKLHDAKPDKIFDKSKAFAGFFLFVDEESFKNTPDHLKLPKNIKIDKSSLDLSVETEEPEKTAVKLDPNTERLSKFLDDEVFQKFQEVVGYNPSQVLRYELGGDPLYYSRVAKKYEDVLPAPSFNPSSRRVFEMQLMPKMILDLEDEVSIKDGMDWGTIMVFTDVENWVPEFDEHGVGYVEECVRVQWESEK